MYNFSVFIKDLMGAAISSSISTTEFVGQLIEYTADDFEIYNKNGELLFFSKSRISDLMRNKTDIPKCMRETTAKVGHQKRYESIIQLFADDMLDKALLDESAHRLRKHINDAENISANQKPITKENDVVKLIANAYILAIKVNNRIYIDDKPITIWENGTSSIEIISGDIFKFGFDNRKKGRRITVIPVNTTFETHITTQAEKTQYQLVSENTLHGMWLSRMFKAQITENELKQRIDENLNSQGIDPLSHSHLGRRNVYPIGTISTIVQGNSVFYLTAISDFNEHGLAHSKRDDVEKCVTLVVQRYDYYGQGDHLYIPLMGTGRSRANLSNQESYDLIVSTLISNKERLHGNISIVVLPEVIMKLKIERR